jgi:hypothetical protein
MIFEQEKILSKARKLKELADRGVDGEKETAERMYAQYKIKYNLTDEQVKGFTKQSKYDNMNYSEFIKNNKDLYTLIGMAVGMIVLQMLSKRNTSTSMRSKVNIIIDEAIKSAKKHSQ